MSHLSLLDRLLDQSSISESKEHVLEQMHYALDKVDQKALARYDELVASISNDIGAPEFNASLGLTEGSKVPVPAWVINSKKPTSASHKMMRLCYWRRETGVSFLVLRQELDSKDRLKYYDLVIGGRKRTRTNTNELKNLRKTDSSFVGWIKRKLKGEGEK
jgi:hypothetical protein